MKDEKITVCIVNKEKKIVIDQIDKNVPDIFNIYEVCDTCQEADDLICETCIVRLLQSEKYFV